MKTTLNTYQLIEYEFTKSFVEFINSYNELDYNISTCIARIITDKTPNLAYHVIQKLSTQEKIDLLKQILMDRKFVEKWELVDDFNEWSLKAEKSKAYRYRNYFVNGKWHTIAANIEKPIIFKSLNHRVSQDLQFSLDEFHYFSNEMKSITNNFNKFREKLFSGGYE